MIDKEKGNVEIHWQSGGLKSLRPITFRTCFTTRLAFSIFILAKLYHNNIRFSNKYDFQRKIFYNINTVFKISEL